MVKNDYPYVPIIAKPSDNMDLLFFSDMDTAERGFENYDIENNYWTVFDARGKLLKPIVKNGYVHILIDNSVPKHVTELEQYLREFLVYNGDIWYEHARDMHLVELIKLCDKYINVW